MRTGRGEFSGLFGVLLVLCSCGGTETGNPLYNDSNAEPPTSIISLASEKILSSICAKLIACHATLLETQCKQGILASTSIDTELGLPINSGTFQSIVAAERSNLIQPQESFVSACQSELEAVSCASPAAQAAYDPGAPGDFSRVSELVSGGTVSCIDVF